jgi:molecular chaperone Hsp33
VRALAETIRANELYDRDLPLESLLWRLFHEEDEVRVLTSVPLTKGCRCSFEYVRGVIARFAPEEREQMVDDDGFISVDCEFCSRVFPIRLDDLEA